MLPQRINFVIPQGATFSNTMTLVNANGTPMVLNGYSANGEIRHHFDSCNPTASFTIVVGGNAGQMSISLDANTTANIYYGRYVYDINLTDPSGNVARIFEGQIFLTPGVTRSANSPV